MAVTPNPRLPPIPQPIADIGALTAVAQALKQRVDNLAGYVASLGVSQDATDKQVSAQFYTLPVASTSVLGGVKVDGESVTVTDEVLSAAVPSPATALPGMDGTASVGTSARFTREDHVHPTDAAIAAEATARMAADLTEANIRGAADRALSVAINAAMPFVFNQATPAATWTIAHHLGRFPSIEVVDSSGRLVEGDVTYTSSNAITVAFVAAFSGVAYLN